MSPKQTSTTTAAALRNFGLAAGGAVLLASAWASGAAPEGALMLDERVFREEIVAAGEDRTDEGWYEIRVSADAVAVRTVAQPRCGEAVRENALYLHLPGTPLTEGIRVNHGFPAEEFRPVAGQDYRRALGRTEYSFRLDSSAAGTEFVARYGGGTYRYLLGLPAAASKVHAVVDLDGDRQPDFVVEVGGEIYLLLSSQARPGWNLPSAQLWAAAE